MKTIINILFLHLMYIIPNYMKKKKFIFIVLLTISYKNFIIMKNLFSIFFTLANLLYKF